MTLPEFSTALPSKLLEPYVHFYFQQRLRDVGKIISDKYYAQNTLPTGCTVIGFNFIDPIQVNIYNKSFYSVKHKVFVAGQFDSLYAINLPQNTDLFGVVLRPITAHRLIKMPINNLKNLLIEANYHICKSLTELYEKIAEVSFLSRIQLFEQWIIPKIIPNKYNLFTDWVVDEIIKSKGIVTINYLAKTLKVSERHLQRSFKEHVGIQPYKYATIVKINNLVNNFNQKNDRFIDLLYDYQYFDKSHFRKQFKAITHTTLSSYLGLQDAAAQTFLDQITF